MNDSALDNTNSEPGAKTERVRIPGWCLFLLVSVIIIVDQYTKYLSTLNLDLGVPVNVFPGFDLLLAHNEGAAFSFLNDASGWQRWVLAAISTGVSVVLAIWLWRMPRNQQLLAVALTFILGGALGNLYDRVAMGYVVDFISVYYGSWRFATFNIADAAISCGAVLLVLDVLLNGVRDD
ncbi:MAG: signal peptidase II [Pseudomonadota bacterium]